MTPRILRRAAALVGLWQFGLAAAVAQTMAPAASPGYDIRGLSTYAPREAAHAPGSVGYGLGRAAAAPQIAARGPIYVARTADARGGAPTIPSADAYWAPPPAAPVPTISDGQLFDPTLGAGGDCLDACAPVQFPATCWTPPPIIWGGGAGALFLFRESGDHNFFSYDSAIESNQLLDAQDADPEFLPGVEGRVTRFNTCTGRGFEAVYWGVYPGDETTYAYAGDVTGSLDGILNFDQLDYNGGPASAFVNDAVVHRLRGSSQIHNAELNCLCGTPTRGCSPWTIQALAGFRYFNLDEGLQFAADTVDDVFTGAPEELYYTIDVNNHLYGGQLGSYIQRGFGQRWFITGAVKAGVFANDASATSQIGGAAGTAVINNGPNAGRAWLVSSNKTDLAMIGELSAGLACQATQYWRLTADYRVIAVSGVALPINQVYPDLRGLQDVELLSTSDDLLLHGAFFGVQRGF